MKFVEIDETKLPIITIQFQAFSPNDEQFGEFLADIEIVYRNHTGVVLVYDGRNLNFVSSKQRIRLGKWLKENKELVKSAIKGSCYIIPGGISRLMMNAVFIIQKPEWETKIVKTQEEADVWVNWLAEK